MLGTFERACARSVWLKSSEQRDVAKEKVGEFTKGFMVQDLEAHVKDLDFYSE